MGTLHLNLKRKWFDMILNGYKLEEYRDFKYFWINRLTEDKSYCQMGCEPVEYVINQKQFDTITFSNGYAKNRPQMVVKLDGIKIHHGLEEWGAEKDKNYFVLSLGHVISYNQEN